jgi:ParB family transcriptional regulator, chromosome partitioning protein
MSKADDLLRSLGGGAAKSMIGDQVPPGLDPAAALGPGHSPGMTRRKDVWSIPLDRIEPDPDQPRVEYDEEALDRLAESLRSRGQLQPIRVRHDQGRGVYMILLGERRYRAARRAGLRDLQCVIHDAPLGPEEKLELQLVENCAREDLKPIEQARAYRRLIDARGWSITRLARELSVSQPAVSKALALLELPATVQDQVERGALAPNTAYEVSQLADPEAQAALAEAVVEQKLTRAEVAQAVQAVKARRPTPAARPAPVDLDLGDGVAIRITYRKASPLTPAQALRRGLKVLADRERQEVGAA